MVAAAAPFPSIVEHATGTADGYAEITAALAQTLESMDELVRMCRARCVDPMAMVMKIMSAAANGSGPVAPRPPAAVRASSIDARVPCDEEVTRRSRDLIDALDRRDVAAVAAATAPGFVRFAGDAAIDREEVMRMLVQHRASPPCIQRRTWAHESVVRKNDAIVFTGKAQEIQAGNETKGGYLHDGWYLMQWVPCGDAWRVQLLTWQKVATDRDHFNDVFLKGRGYSRDPNRLLVEAVGAEKPGTALDLATGQGRNGLYLAAQGWNVIGVDSSEEGLRLAREEAVRRDLPLETIHADIDEWDFGIERWDLVTLMYAGDHARWTEKIKTGLRPGGLLVVEGWAATSDGAEGFAEGQLARLFDGYEILRDDTVDDVPDWAWDKGTLVRFVARKPAS